MTAIVSRVLASFSWYLGLRTSLIGPPPLVSASSEWHFRQVSFTEGRSAWSGGGMGVGNTPVITPMSCLVPFAFALIQPAAPGSTWHSAQVTSLCGDIA